jgi:hypothetical protein
MGSRITGMSVTLDPLVLLFIVLPMVLVLMLASGAAAATRRMGEPPAIAWRRAVIVGVAGALWMAATWIVAASGVLRQWDRLPPPLALLVFAIIALAITIALSPLGRGLATGLPLWVLIASQAFRLPLELAMHAMFERGVMPEQMSYSGYNFDIVTGSSAIVVAAAIKAGIGGTRLAAIWNIVGLALLLNIVGIAIASTPLFAAFGSDRLNVWVTEPPFVWLPAVMVLMALAGHLVIFRALALTRRTPGGQLTMRA